MTDPVDEDVARTLRLALVNDYPLVIAGLAASLSTVASVEVVELDSGNPVTAEVDVILFDTFGHVDGLCDFIRHARAPVVVFTLTHDADSVAAARDAGAAGVISKSLTTPELVAALEKARHHEFVVELGPAAETPHPSFDSWPGKMDGLTYRESEILALICQGLTNQQVAETLYLSINSVKTYIRTAYRKMGVESRTQAVLWGLEHCFAPPVARMIPPPRGHEPS